MYQSEISSLKQISSLVTDNIDRWGDDNSVLVEELASSQLVIHNQITELQTELKNKRAQDSRFRNIMYIDVSGQVLADSLGSKALNIADKSYFSDICKEYSNVSNLIYENGSSFFIFSSPVKKDNQIIGYIVSEVDASSMGSSFGKINNSDQGQILVFNHSGEVMYSNHQEETQDNNLLSNQNVLSTAAKNALDGYFSSAKYGGKEKGVAVYNFIPSLNWGIILTTPNHIVYSGFRQMIKFSVPISLVIIILTILLATYIVRKFMGVVGYLLQFTVEVANGNLNMHANIGSTLEVAHIRDNLNAMVDSLRQLVLSIADNSDSLMDASNELGSLSNTAEENSRMISASMEEISSGSIEQAEQTEYVLGQVKDLDQQLKKLIQNIAETNQALAKSEEALSKGSRETGELQVATAEQNQLVTKAVMEIHDLAGFVEKVDSILEAISDISAQTSLLALNASIEAARAGEHGKGFAVVAEEVAKLANESRDATQKTSDILQSIKGKAEGAKTIMESLNHGMEQQVTIVDGTMGIFQEINSADRTIVENVKSVSDLVVYVKDFSDKLLGLMETVSSSTEENVAVSEEVTASSEEQLLGKMGRGYHW